MWKTIQWRIHHCSGLRRQARNLLELFRVEPHQTQFGSWSEVVWREMVRVMPGELDLYLHREEQVGQTANQYPALGLANRVPVSYLVAFSLLMRLHSNHQTRCLV